MTEALPPLLEATARLRLTIEPSCESPGMWFRTVRRPIGTLYHRYENREVRRIAS